jgi:hypothetical protein
MYYTVHEYSRVRLALNLDAAVLATRDPHPPTRAPAACECPIRARGPSCSGWHVSSWQRAACCCAMPSSQEPTAGACACVIQVGQQRAGPARDREYATAGCRARGARGRGAPGRVGKRESAVGGGGLEREVRQALRPPAGRGGDHCGGGGGGGVEHTARRDRGRTHTCDAPRTRTPDGWLGWAGSHTIDQQQHEDEGEGGLFAHPGTSTACGSSRLPPPGQASWCHTHHAPSTARSARPNTTGQPSRMAAHRNDDSAKERVRRAWTPDSNVRMNAPLQLAAAKTATYRVAVSVKTAGIRW